MQQLTDRPDHLEVSILPMQEQVKQVCEIALEFTPDTKLETILTNWARLHMSGSMPFRLSQLCGCAWACQNAGMSEHHTGIFSLRTLEMACRLVGIEVAESAVPTVLHPIVASSAVSGSDEDQHALWVRMVHEYPEMGPPEWLASAYQFMAGFTAADPDFWLYDVNEQFSLVQLLNKSLDVCDDAAFSQLHHMMFTFFGNDPCNKVTVIMHWIKTVEQLNNAMDDLYANALGLDSFQFPSQYPLPGLPNNVIKWVFTLDLEYETLDPIMTEGIECKDAHFCIRDWSTTC